MSAPARILMTPAVLFACLFIVAQHGFQQRGRILPLWNSLHSADRLQGVGKEAAMIYSASRRTDMPAFHPDRIVERVKRSRKLEGIVLWTKDIRNCVDHFGLTSVLKTVPCLVNFTVTGLAGTQWEPNVPPLAEQTAALAECGKRLPRGAIRWRFDPIIATKGWRERFTSVKECLEKVLGKVDHVTASFPEPYRKAAQRVRNAALPWPTATLDEMRSALAWMVKQFPAGAEPGVRLCCEPELLGISGVGGTRCIDSAVFDRLYGTNLGDLAKDAGQRTACGCVQSTDIGSYDMPCRHRCLYCYARPEEPERRPAMA